MGVLEGVGEDTLGVLGTELTGSALAGSCSGLASWGYLIIPLGAVTCHSLKTRTILRATAHLH